MGKPLDVILHMEREDWDRNAAFYRRDERSPLMRAQAAKRESFYRIQRGRRVLDLGCGAGGTVSKLRARGVEAVGIDFSPAMIEAARSEHGLKNYVTCAEATELPFESDSFDVVIADGVLHHLAVQGRLNEALREVHRVLRPGGKLCCFDRNGTLASYLLLRMAIGIKELIRFATRGDRYAGSATRNEIPFGTRKDLETLRRCGFKLVRRRDVASAPFFMSVVMLNTVQYFLSERLRRSLEPKVCRLLAWVEAHCTWRRLSVEALAVFEAKPCAAYADRAAAHANPEPVATIAMLATTM